MSLDAFTVELAVRERLNLAAVKVRDLTSPFIDLESALQRGEHARRVRDEPQRRRQTTPIPMKPRCFEDALRYGLMALSGAEVGLR